jgi:AraC-like DNA-binding protein
VADYPPGARTGPRVIDDFELVWMLRGQAVYVTEDGEGTIPPGVLLLVRPGVRHSFAWDTGRPSRHGYVHFDHDLGPGTEVRRMTDHDPLAGLCAYLVWLGRERPDAWEDRVDMTLRFLLSAFIEGPLPIDDAGLPAPLAAAADHLRREWSSLPLRRLGVDELAASAGVSRSYLSRTFRAAFGRSVGVCLEGLRCSRAETLLLRTDMSIGSIARHCGFADLFHFSHRFARRYGIAPSAYRRRASPPSVLDDPGMGRLARAVWP